MRKAIAAVGRTASVVMTGVLLCGLPGCFAHKKVAPQQVVLPPQLPVALETLPVEANPPLVETPRPTTKLPEIPVAEAATKPKKVKRKTKVAAAPPPSATAPVANASTASQALGAPGGSAPVQMASLGGAASSDTVIGALTPGGSDENPRSRQDAQELLSTTDKRLNSLPLQTQQTQKAQISQIRNFWKQGVEALHAGDAEGAKTLATKAKLLLDDLETASR